jgi:hypothetical protein
MAGSKKTIKHPSPSHRLLASSQDVTDDEDWADAPAREKSNKEEPDHDAVLSGDETYHTDNNDDYSDDDDATTDKAVVPFNVNDDVEPTPIKVLGKRKSKPSKKVSVFPTFTFTVSFGFPEFPANPTFSRIARSFAFVLKQKDQVQDH